MSVWYRRKRCFFDRSVLDNVFYGKQGKIADTDIILHSLRIPRTRHRKG